MSNQNKRSLNGRQHSSGSAKKRKYDGLKNSRDSSTMHKAGPCIKQSQFDEEIPALYSQISSNVHKSSSYNRVGKGQQVPLQSLTAINDSDFFLSQDAKPDETPITPTINTRKRQDNTGDDSNTRLPSSDNRLIPSRHNLKIIRVNEFRKRTSKPRFTESSTPVIAENTKLRKLDRDTRWMCFLWHGHEFKHQIIREIWPEIDVDDQKYQNIRLTIMGNVRSYKSQVLSRVIEHVREVIKSTKDERNDILLMSKQQLRLFFEKKWNASNFISIWSYMKNLLDVDRSTAWGQWVMQSKYCNLATEAVQVVKRIDGGNPNGANIDLSSLYSAMPLHDDYEGQGIEHYFELHAQPARARKSKSLDTDILQKSFGSISKPPPPKGTLLSGSSDNPGTITINDPFILSSSQDSIRHIDSEVDGDETEDDIHNDDESGNYDECEYGD